jgi:transcriptional regulator with XRE-family HTH domain/predicted secreted protein
MENIGVGGFAARFIEERDRLGFSQADFARATGLSRTGIRKIEDGTSEFRVGVLERAAALGMDVQYVVTGVRSSNVNKVLDQVGYEKQAIHGVVSGVGFAGPGSQVRIVHTQNHVTRVKAETKPGAEHISVEQRAILKDLVDKVVETETAVSRKPKTHRAVWAALNAHCKVPSYSLIPAEDFEKARKYLHQWLGRLGSLASAPVKDGDNWRKRHYAYIKINTKDPEDRAALDDYLKRTFGASSSLTELANDDLDKVYRYVAGRRNRRK